MKQFFAIIITMMIITCIFVLSGCSLSTEQGSNPNGIIPIINGPDKAAIMPGQISGSTMAINYSDYSNVQNDGYNVSFSQDGSYCGYSGVNLINGMLVFKGLVSCESRGGGSIEVRLDSPAGKLIAIEYIPASGLQPGWWNLGAVLGNWTSTSVVSPYTGAVYKASIRTGIYNIYLVYRGTGGRVKINSFSFQGGSFPGSYAIINRNSGRALSITDFSKNPGAQAQIWDQQLDPWAKNPSPYDQTWGVYQGKPIDAANGKYHYTIWCANGSTGGYLPLGVSGASSNPGAAIVQWTSDNSDNQNWDMVPVEDGSGYFYIQNAATGQVISCDWGNDVNGTKLIQYPKQGNWDQQWLFLF